MVDANPGHPQMIERYVCTLCLKSGRGNHDELSQPRLNGSGEAASSEFLGWPDLHRDAGLSVSTVGMYELCGTKGRETSCSGLFALKYQRRP